MKWRGVGYYCIAIGALAVAAAVVLGGLILVWESMGVHYSQIPPLCLVLPLLSGIFLVALGSRLFLAEAASTDKNTGEKTNRLVRGVAESTKPKYHIVAVSKDGYVKRFPVRGLDIFDVLIAIKSRLRTAKQLYRIGAGRYADIDNEWTIYISEAPALADIFESASRDTLSSMLGRAPPKKERK